jgi:hypothetical protein
MEPAFVVDLLDEVGKMFSDVLEGFERHRIDGLNRACRKVSLLTRI